MLRILSIFAVVAGLAIGLPQTAAHAAPAAKKTSKKAVAKDEVQTADDGKEEASTAGMSSAIYNCELGNKVTIYQASTNSDSILMRWRNRMHRLVRISTSTGADRFENTDNGLVWIGIPAKGILLDSKKGQQLANECKTPEQMRSVTHTKLEGST